jgi:hypothetical protein
VPATVGGRSHIVNNGSIMVENRGRGPITLQIPKLDTSGKVIPNVYDSYEWGDPADRGRKDNPNPVQRFSVAKWESITTFHQAAVAKWIHDGVLTVSKAV